MILFVLNGLFCTPNVSKNSQMLQPFTRTLNFRIISISLEFSKNETATVSRPYSALLWFEFWSFLENICHKLVLNLAFFIKLRKVLKVARGIESAIFDDYIRLHTWVNLEILE